MSVAMMDMSAAADILHRLKAEWASAAVPSAKAINASVAELPGRGDAPF